MTLTQKVWVQVQKLQIHLAETLRLTFEMSQIQSEMENVRKLKVQPAILLQVT